MTEQSRNADHSDGQPIEIDPSLVVDIDIDIDANDVAADEVLYERLAAVSRAFSPSSPITTKDLFSGRTAQLNRIEDVVNQRGQHALIYGERGVGKTSLARVAMGLGPAGITSYYTCHSDDTFASIWRGVFEEIKFFVDTAGPGFLQETKRTIASLSAYLDVERVNPQDVRRLLERASSTAPIVIFIDEFDRPTDGVVRTLTADLIKILSDQGINVTVVLIGVARSVSELIAEHASIGRSLVQIQMPVMNAEESLDIIDRGMRSADLDYDKAFAIRVSEISQGLPHYTHLIAQHGARIAVEDRRTSVSEDDVKRAVELAVRDVSQTVREDYHRATYSNRETIYREVLLACALVPKNAIGEFGSGAVREQLNRITGRNFHIPAFSSHLAAFSAPEGPRGGILHKVGSKARYDYRFVDPLMPPYVIMKGIEGLLL